MNYCDYYLKVLSIYISTRAVLPLDLFFSDIWDFYMWYPGVDDKVVVLYLQSSSWKVYLTVESRVHDSDHTNLSFVYNTNINENRKIPIGYEMKVMLE